jgi:hypothetical protein
MNNSSSVCIWWAADLLKYSFPNNLHEKTSETFKTLLYNFVTMNKKQFIENLEFHLGLNTISNAGNMSQIFVYTLDGRKTKQWKSNLLWFFTNH